MKFLAIALVSLALVATAGAADRSTVTSNPNADNPLDEPQHGPQNGEGLEIVALRATTIYYNQAAFLAAIAAGYYYDDFSWLGWGTISNVTSYQFGPVNGFAYSAYAFNGLYSVPGAMSTNTAGDPLALTFNGLPVTAVGGDFLATDFNGYPVSDVTTITLNDGTVVALTYPTTFVGFTSDVPITSLTITCGTSNWATYDNFYVGQFAVSAVEEQSWSTIKALYR